MEMAGGAKGRPTGRSLLLRPRLIQVFDAPITCASFCRFIRIDPTKANPEYVFWLPQFLYTSRQISQFNTQHTGLSRFQYTKFATTYRFPLHQRPQQEKIAAILRDYDDLIENNRRRIKLLEEAAQLLYKEWFVHLRFPGHEHTKIIDGLPEGWERKTFADVCQAIGGGTPSTKRAEYWAGGDITWITPTDITRNDCLVLLDSEKKITRAGLRHSSAELVPPDTILMTSRASVGFFGIIDKEVCTNQRFISVVPNEEQYRMYLLYTLIHRVEEIRANAGGATYKEINKSRFRAMPVVMPADELLKTFQSIVYPMIRFVRVLKKQNAQLAEARDLLLPRLMSGELRFEELNHFVPENPHLPSDVLICARRGHAAKHYVGGFAEPVIERRNTCRRHHSLLSNRN